MPASASIWRRNSVNSSSSHTAVGQATDTVYVVAVRHGRRRAMGEPGEDD